MVNVIAGGAKGGRPHQSGAWLSALVGLVSAAGSTGAPTRASQSWGERRSSDGIIGPLENRCPRVAAGGGQYPSRGQRDLAPLD